MNKIQHQLPAVDPEPERQQHQGMRVLTKLGTYGILLYVVFVSMLSINETRLVYPGSRYPRGNWQPTFPMEEVAFKSADGTKIVGWYLPLPGATETALLCHGNAENVAQASKHYGLKFQSVLNANVFVFDYRGYGKSEGDPHEQGILLDAEAAMSWLNQKTNTQPSEVFIIGHSIGGGPAVHLASTLGAKGLFLQRTFSSLVEPAQSRFWFVPVSYIMRNRYPSIEKITNCVVPLHQSHGETDAVVPISSGRRLFDASPAPIKEFFINKNCGHLDPLPFEYWNSVRVFAERVNATATNAESLNLKTTTAHLHREWQMNAKSSD